jgi:hypothetical protein
VCSSASKTKIKIGEIKERKVEEVAEYESAAGEIGKHHVFYTNSEIKQSEEKKHERKQK